MDALSGWDIVRLMLLVNGVMALLMLPLFWYMEWQGERRVSRTPSVPVRREGKQRRAINGMAMTLVLVVTFFVLVML